MSRVAYFLVIALISIIVSYADVSVGGRILFLREIFGIVIIVFCCVGAAAASRINFNTIASVALSGLVFIGAYIILRFSMLSL
jgi:hypothetical protein